MMNIASRLIQIATEMEGAETPSIKKSEFKAPSDLRITSVEKDLLAIACHTLKCSLKELAEALMHQDVMVVIEEYLSKPGISPKRTLKPGPDRK